MRLSKEDIDAKVVKLYKSGWSYRQLQKRYHKSPNDITKLVRGIEVTCTACGKPKGKVRFHAHHPDRINFPDYTIPLCPSCHAKEEAKLRRQKENKLQSPPNPIVPTTQTLGNTSRTTSIPVRLGPISPTGKKVLTVIGIVSFVETFSPGFFDKWLQEIKDRWQRS